MVTMTCISQWHARVSCLLPLLYFAVFAGAGRAPQQSFLGRFRQWLRSGRATAFLCPARHAIPLLVQIVLGPPSLPALAGHRSNRPWDDSDSGCGRVGPPQCLCPARHAIPFAHTRRVCRRWQGTAAIVPGTILTVAAVGSGHRCSCLARHAFP